MVRSAWAAGPSDTTTPESVADAAGAMFDAYASQLFTATFEVVRERRGLLFGDPASNWVTYPARATRTGELLGLLALRQRQHRDEEELATVEVLAELARTHPGVAHPISDRYATCAIPLVLALATEHPDLAARLVRSMTVWMCDRFEASDAGLAPTDAPPDQELEYLFGAPFEFIDLPNHASYIPAVLADLAAVLQDAELYDDVRNDTLAVRAVATVIQTTDDHAQYLRSGPGVVRILPVEYTDELPADCGAPAAHHRQAADDVALTRLGRPWDLLAVQSVLRDRHWGAAMRAVAPASG